MVSIIINCHNSDEYLYETLESVKAQTYEDYEIILWDNASTDRTRDIAAEHGGKLKYYYSPEYISLGAARNKALSKCNGEYIAFLDSDDLWEKGKLAVQVAAMEADSDIGLIMTNFKVLNMFNGELSKSKPRMNRIYGFEEFIINYSYVLSTFLIRKKLVDKLNMWFDERLQYAEEYDFFSRLVFEGKALYIGEPLATRRIHGKMNTIALAPRIPVEHQMTLDNLREYIPDFDSQYPAVVRKIEYIRDYMDAKYRFTKAPNKEIRKLVRPYISEEKKAAVYYLIACLPKQVSIAVLKRIYHNSI